MAVELQVPRVGESITEVEIGEWLKSEGDSVEQDEIIVMLDTAKTTVELPSPVSGVLAKVLKQTGDGANVGDVIAHLDEGGAANGGKPDASSKDAIGKAEPEPAATTKTATTPPRAEQEGHVKQEDLPVENKEAPRIMPAAARALAENDVKAGDVAASGPGGRLLKEDVQRHVEAAASTSASPSKSTPPPRATPAASSVSAKTEAVEARADEEVVRMSMLRREIARRLVEAQQTAALLTTFNEVDMTAVMAMRKENQDAFVKKYGIKLGFMSFFVKACVDALKQYPAVNAEVRGDSIVYRNHFDIGVAIGSGKGLVVPVLRRAERMSFAEIEQGIADYAGKVKNNSITPDDLSGGTFTITNGGVYGSLLSTPIVNPPQSGILGMHGIQERPIALNGEVVIRPMMYIALTYDHRVVDGREAVSFLKRVADCVENPARMLIEV